MSLRPRSLRARLFVAHLAVVVIGAGTLMLVARLTLPRLFDLHVAAMSQHGPMPGHTPGAADVMSGALTDALQQSLNQSLLIGGLMALVAGLLVSILVTRQIASPIRRLAMAAGQIAAGRYSERVPESEMTELDLLTHSFNDMATALEETEQRRVRLIGDVAHELRTPLSTLQAYLEGLADGVEAPSEELWLMLRAETGRMGRLVEDMQELSRAESGQLPLDMRPVAPQSIVEATVARLGADFAAKGLTLRVDVPAPLPEVLADRDRAIQVLTNLLTNALRYTPPQGEVAVGVTREGEAVRFSVRDSGAGLNSEQLRHVFERFYRADASRSRAEGGTGVGLTIARALVEAMGGRIEAASAGTGQGALFSFTLAAATSPRAS